MNELWLFKKYPRSKKVCRNCQTSRWGLMRPNYPFCSVQCREQFLEMLPPNLEGVSAHSSP